MKRFLKIRINKHLCFMAICVVLLMGSLQITKAQTVSWCSTARKTTAWSSGNNTNISWYSTYSYRYCGCYYYNNYYVPVLNVTGASSLTSGGILTLTFTGSTYTSATYTVYAVTACGTGTSLNLSTNLGSVTSSSNTINIEVSSGIASASYIAIVSSNTSSYKTFSSATLTIGGGGASTCSTTTFASTKTVDEDKITILQSGETSGLKLVYLWVKTPESSSYTYTGFSGSYSTSGTGKFYSKYTMTSTGVYKFIATDNNYAAPTDDCENIVSHNYTISSHTITANANDENMGSVTGGGSFYFKETTTLTATPTDGYYFVQWDDGDKQNPRTVRIQKDATYTAIFKPLINYTITAISTDDNMGSVSGGGIYNDSTTIFLSATPAAHYHFVKWNDEITENPRSFIPSENKTLKAIFAIDTHTLSVSVDNAEQGSVVIHDMADAYDYGTEVTLEATPNSGYKFARWNDGNTQNPRNITITQNTTFVATFEIYNYKISVNATDATMGIVTGGGNYQESTYATITATPKNGYKFVCWNDGNTQNPRTIIVKENKTYTAQFNSLYFYISVKSNNSNYGTVWGEDIYAYQEVATIAALPNNGYVFTKWNDGNTTNPRQITVNSDATYTATFAKQEATNAIAEANSSNAQILSGEKRIIINNAENATIAIYDVTGKTVVKEQRLNTNNEVFAIPQTGLYLVRINNTAKKILVK